MKKILLCLCAVMVGFYCQAQVKRTVSKSNMIVVEPYDPSVEKVSGAEIWSGDTLIRADDKAMRLNQNYNTGQNYGTGQMRPPLQGVRR